MTRVIVLDERVAQDLATAGIDVVGVLTPSQLVDAATDAAYGAEAPAIWAWITSADAIILPVSRDLVTPEVVAFCDRAGVRIVAVADDAAGRQRAEMAGLSCVEAGDQTGLIDLVTTTRLPASDVPADVSLSGRVIAVWGPPGAPGRSTVAVLLAAELVRGGRRVALVDADSHAPSLALALGLADEGPGFAAACRAAASSSLHPAELARISQQVATREGIIDVLCGINRPGRWPELAHERVGEALRVSRDWADYVVVDVAAPLDRDEEVVSDLAGPRRNAATLAVLEAADLVVAVGSADPLGASRMLRGLDEIRSVSGVTPVCVTFNRLRSGALGFDARGQLRRALERFAGVEDVWFLPSDPRAVDAAMLHGRPVSEAAPRSALVESVRRLVGEGVIPALTGGSRSAVPGSSARSKAQRGATRSRAVDRDRDEYVHTDGSHDAAALTDPLAGQTRLVMPLPLRPERRSRHRPRRRDRRTA